jgi:hypothetical protein
VPVTSRTGALQKLRMFVASPGDVERERDHVNKVADELNRAVAPEAGFILEVVRWETHSRPDMGRIQQIINDQIGSVDVFIGIMWQRFGTPTGVAESGSEEEFDRAFESWQTIGHPRILYYFSEAPIRPPRTLAEAEQLLSVTRFREHVQEQGLSFTYESDDEFKDLLRNHLEQILLKEFKGRRPPIDRKLQALLNKEKARCQERGVGFFTANLLHTLLSSDQTVRTIFETACPEPVDSLANTLREFMPRDKKGDPIPFKDFDWFERKDVQNARYRASVQAAPAIDARMLLYAVLTENSGTQQALKKKLGDEAFERLRGQAEAQDSPGITNLKI